MIPCGVFFGGNAKPFDIAAVEVGIVAETAVSEGFLYGHSAVNFLAGERKALNEYIIPQCSAGNLFEPFVHVGFADPEVFA